MPGWVVPEFADIAANIILHAEHGADAKQSTIEKLQSALEAASVAFTNDDQPGVRLAAATIRSRLSGSYLIAVKAKVAVKTPRGKSDRNGSRNDNSKGQVLRRTTIRARAMRHSAWRATWGGGTTAHNRHVQACQLIFCRGRRGRRADTMVPTHELKCGCRAAQASMAHEMPRSSCCPAKHL